jgi:hypothetical protein
VCDSNFLLLALKFLNQARARAPRALRPLAPRAPRPRAHPARRRRAGLRGAGERVTCGAGAGRARSVAARPGLTPPLDAPRRARLAAGLARRLPGPRPGRPRRPAVQRGVPALVHAPVLARLLLRARPLRAAARASCRRRRPVRGSRAGAGRGASCVSSPEGAPAFEFASRPRPLLPRPEARRIPAARGRARCALRRPRPGLRRPRPAPRPSPPQPAPRAPGTVPLSAGRARAGAAAGR